MRNKAESTSINLAKELFKQYGFESKETTNQYEHYDLLVDDRIRVEVKGRRLNLQQFIDYGTEGFILERTKFDYLKQFSGRYVNTFNINGYDIILIWNVNKLPARFETKRCRATTDYSRYNYVDKEVMLLYSGKANIFIKVEDKFEKLSLVELIDRIK